MSTQSFPVELWLADLEGRIVGVAGYSTADAHQHVFVATGAGDVRELEMDPNVGYWAWRDPIMHHDVIKGLTAYFHPGDGREHVVVVTDSEVWEFMRRPNEQAQMNWLAHLEGGIVGIAGYSTSDAHQHVFVATDAGDVHELEMDPNVGYWAWRDPIMHHDVINGLSAYFHPGDARQHIFAATNSEVWEFMRRPNEPPRVNWLAHVDGGIVGIAGYSTADAHQHVFVATRGGDVRQIEMDPNIGYWAWCSPIMHHDGITSVTAYFHPGDARQHIFAATDSEIWEVRLCGPSSIRFPIGWFDGLARPLGTPAEIAKDGVNLIVTYNRGTPAEAVPYLDSMSAQCLGAMVQVNPNAIDAANVEELVNALKDRFEIWGWYLFDEPDDGSVSADTAKQTYQLVKSLDPSRVVAIAFRPDSDLGKLQPYLDATDAYMISHYPINAGSAEFDGLSGFYTAFVAYRGKSSKPFWAILQGDQYPGDGGNVRRRLPTLLEERYMMYAAIQAGSNGLFFWTREYSTDQWASSVLAPLVGEVKGHSSAFAAGELAGTTSASLATTHASLYPSDQGFVLLLINHDSGKAITKLTLAASVGFASVREGGQSLSSNVLSSPFALGPYEVRLLELLH